MNARYYEPGTGRFISEDTYRGEGEAFWHLYLYCNGDPVNNTDPSGHRMKKRITKKAHGYSSNTNSKTLYQWTDTTTWGLPWTYIEISINYYYYIKKGSDWFDSCHNVVSHLVGLTTGLKWTQDRFDSSIKNNDKTLIVNTYGHFTIALYLTGVLDIANSDVTFTTTFKW